jgi:hypothetical protein
MSTRRVERKVTLEDLERETLSEDMKTALDQIRVEEKAPKRRAKPRFRLFPSKAHKEKVKA